MHAEAILVTAFLGLLVVETNGVRLRVRDHNAGADKQGNSEQGNTALHGREENGVCDGLEKEKAFRGVIHGS